MERRKFIRKFKLEAVGVVRPGVAGLGCIRRSCAAPPFTVPFCFHHDNVRTTGPVRDRARGRRPPRAPSTLFRVTAR
jgi:hypothetical protein